MPRCGSCESFTITAQIEELAVASRDAARTEERLRFILPTARIAVAEIDRALCIQWIYDPRLIPDGSKAVGMNIRDLDEHKFAEELATTLERVIQSGVGERVELSPQTPGPAHLLASFEPRRDANGDVSGVLVATTDITELKETELALGRAVAFREQVLAILAHDLKNPLSSVLALARLYARNEQVPTSVRSALSQIDLASQRMVELIDTLHDFSAARFGHTLPVTRVYGDLEEVARAAVDELRSTAPERVIELRATGDTRGTWDPARMAQVVSNLVGNALMHGAAGKPVVVDVEGQEGRVCLRVTNLGPPIAAEVMPRLFEPFRRGGDPHAQPRGLGLGLYIAQEIVRAHGGAIDLVSTLERGTVFTVDIPRAPCGSAGPDRSGSS
jgi:signal transduction histidine kinase